MHTPHVRRGLNRYIRDLLSMWRERPCTRCADEQSNEGAPFHVWLAPAWQEITSRAAQKSLAALTI
jgi:hypothetical protein